MHGRLSSTHVTLSNYIRSRHRETTPPANYIENLYESISWLQGSENDSNYWNENNIH